MLEAAFGPDFTEVYEPISVLQKSVMQVQIPWESMESATFCISCNQDVRQVCPLYVLLVVQIERGGTYGPCPLKVTAVVCIPSSQIVGKFCVVC